MAAGRKTPNGKVMSENEPVLYTTRWFLAVALSLYQLLSYANLSYGVVNDVYVQYFGIAYAQVDLMSTAFYVGTVPVIPVLAWLYYSGQMQLRRLTLLGTGTMSLGLLAISCAFLNPALFGLTVAGQIVNGVAAIIAKAIISAFAVAWFPDHQVGTAIGITMFGSSSGALMSTAVMGFVVDPKQGNFSAENATSETGLPGMALLDSVRSLFIYNLACASVSFCTFVFLVVFFADHPPTPPTRAQARKREADDSNGKSFKNFFNETKKLFTDGAFVLLAIGWTLYIQTLTIQLAFMGEIIRDMQVPDPYSKTSWIIVSYYIGCSAGALFAGKLIDKFGVQKYVLLVRIESLVSLFFSVLLYVGILYKRVWFVVGCNALFGVSLRMCFITMMEIVAQHTYPVAEGFVGLNVLLVDTVFGVLITELGRLVYSTLGSDAMMALQSVVLLIGAVICWTAKVQLRRAEAENDETTRLIPPEGNST